MTQLTAPLCKLAIVILSCGCCSCIRHQTQLGPSETETHSTIDSNVAGFIESNVDKNVESNVESTLEFAISSRPTVDANSVYIVETATALPQSHHLSLVKRDKNGRIWRAEHALRSPLGWSQRFPADFFTSLWPIALHYRDHQLVTWQRVPSMEISALDALASKYGYADPGEQQSE